MKKAGAAALMLLTSCFSAGAFDYAVNTAHEVATRAVATEQAISALCEEQIIHDRPWALERCDAAYAAYDRTAKALDALLALLEAAKAAQAAGQDVDEAGLMQATLDLAKAGRELDAALRALGGDA